LKKNRKTDSRKILVFSSTPDSRRDLATKHRQIHQRFMLFIEFFTY
jgi:hypothetical protein